MNTKVQDIFVGKATVNANASGTIVKISGSDTALGVGSTAVAESDIYLLNDKMKIIAATADLTDYIYVAQGLESGVLKLSDKIKTKGIKSIRREPARLGRVHTVTLGYDATLNALATLEADFTKTYEVTIRFKDTFRTAANRDLVLDLSNYCTGTATLTYAQKLAYLTLFVDSINKHPKFSKLVTATAQGDGSALVGIKLVGKVQPFNPIYDIDMVAFEAEYYQATEFTRYDGPVAVQTLSYGNGTYEQIASEEWKIQGWRGKTNHTLYPFPDNIIYAKKNTTYNTYVIDWDDASYAGTGAMITHPKSVFIAIPVTTPIANTIVPPAETGLTAGAGAAEFEATLAVLTGSTAILETVEGINA